MVSSISLIKWFIWRKIEVSPTISAIQRHSRFNRILTRPMFDRNQQYHEKYFVLQNFGFQFPKLGVLMFEVLCLLVGFNKSNLVLLFKIKHRGIFFYFYLYQLAFVINYTVFFFKLPETYYCKILQLQTWLKAFQFRSLKKRKEKNCLEAHNSLYTKK